jgi:hypothetical protein
MSTKIKTVIYTCMATYAIVWEVIDVKPHKDAFPCFPRWAPGCSRAVDGPWNRCFAT